MNDHKPIWAIVPAAGIGKRMMTPQPKQYLTLHARRVLDHSLHALCEHCAVAGVAVGVRDDDKWWRAQPYQYAKLVAVTRGGETRAHTVLNALTTLLGDGHACDDDWVMVHDGVRPCLSAADIDRLIAAARAHGDGAILAARVTDTLKQGDRRGIIETTVSTDDGKVHWRALTPQMFRCAALRDALQAAFARGVTPRDESAAMEMTGILPAAVEGDPANIKITVPADLALAELWLAKKMKSK